MNSRRKKQEGFTLIEIMVVILILGLLATLVVQSLRGATDKAKRTKAMADIAELKTALDRYYIDIGSYPSSDQGLNALVTPPGQGSALKRPQPIRATSSGFLTTPGATRTSIRATAITTP